MYFEQGIQVLHNYRVQTGDAATGPPISILVFYLIILFLEISKQEIHRFPQLLALNGEYPFSPLLEDVKDGGLLLL